MTRAGTKGRRFLRSAPSWSTVVPPFGGLRPGLREPPPRPVSLPQGPPLAPPGDTPTSRIVSSLSPRRWSRISSSPHPAHPNVVRPSERQSSSSPIRTSSSAHPAHLRTVRPESSISATRTTLLPPSVAAAAAAMPDDGPRPGRGRPFSPILTVVLRWPQRLVGCTSSFTAGGASRAPSHQRHARVFVRPPVRDVRAPAGGGRVAERRPAAGRLKRMRPSGLPLLLRDALRAPAHYYWRGGSPRRTMASGRWVSWRGGGLGPNEKGALSVGFGAARLGALPW